MTESKGRIEALKAGYDELKTQQFAPAGGDENGKEDTQMLPDLTVKETPLSWSTEG